MTADFETAYNRARRQYSAPEWLELSVPLQSAAIWKALREIDAERWQEKAFQIPLRVVAAALTRRD